MASFIYQNLNSKIIVKLWWNTEQTACLVIYETKEIPELYFSNQAWFNLKALEYKIIIVQ